MTFDLGAAVLSALLVAGLCAAWKWRHLRIDPDDWRGPP